MPISAIPSCFCNLQASPAYSEEFGLLYECHNLHVNPWTVAAETVNVQGSYQSDNGVASSSSSSVAQMDKSEKTICGFHIHKTSWDSFFYNNSENPNYQELSVCPFFNYTFSVYFNLHNSHPLSHPPPPNCYCGLAGTMRRVYDNNELKLMLICPNYYTNGARPKCTWKVLAKDAQFQKPNGCTHPLQGRGQGETLLLDPRRQVQKGVSNSGRNNNGYNNRHNVRSHYHHQHYDNHNDERFINYHQRSNNYHSSGYNNRYNNNGSNGRNNYHSSGYNNNGSNGRNNYHSSGYNNNDSNGRNNYYSSGYNNNGSNGKNNYYSSGYNNNGSNGRNNSSGQATNKNMNQQARKPNIPLNENNAYKATKEDPLKPEDLNNNISRNNQEKDENQDTSPRSDCDYDDLLVQVVQLKREVKYLLGRVGHYISEYHSELMFRQSSQKKMIELQAQVADAKQQVLELKNEEKKDSNSLECRICYGRSVTHAILPCYHLASCGTCVKNIDKCAICRKPKEGTIRIYC